jgi:hypothetical protein
LVFFASAELSSEAGSVSSYSSVPFTFLFSYNIPTMTPPINNDDIQAKCEVFLKELGVPGFIIFGWQKDDAEFGVVSSFHEMPVNAAVKGMTWALHDFANKSL